MWKKLPKFSKEGLWQRLAIAGTFFVVVALGLAYGLTGQKLSLTDDAGSTSVDAVSAISMIDYQSEVAAVVAPLLSRVSVSGDWDEVDLLKAAQAGRDRLLAMRVPAGARDVHLQTFLLFERWVTTLQSGESTAAVQEATEVLISEQPWLATTTSILRSANQ